MTPEPVQQHGLAVLLQGVGISEVFILVEAGLRRMENQGIRCEQMARLRRHRDVLAAAHDDRMFAKEHDLPVYVAAQRHSVRQDVADLITVADAAEELNYTVQHIRRLARAGTLQRENTSGLLFRTGVLALKRKRERRR